MSPEPRPTGTEASDEASVLEWGGEPDDDVAPRRGPRAPVRFARDLLGDRRLVPVAASLGAVGLLASLLSEWQVTKVAGNLFSEGSADARPIASGIGELGGWGGGYLTGVFLLVAATVVLLLGPPAGRRYARLVVLSVGGALLALLAAVASELDGNSRALDRMMVIQLTPEQFEVVLGRGVWCALFGVAAVTLAAYLAGRHLGPEPLHWADEATADGEPQVGSAAVDPTVDGAPGDWLWRRQPADRDQDGDGDEAPAAPLELTVSPAAPFTPQFDDRDKLGPAVRDTLH